MVAEEKLSQKGPKKLIEDYLFAEREPIRDEVLALIEGAPPSLLERKNWVTASYTASLTFETFINGMAAKAGHAAALAIGHRTATIWRYLQPITLSSEMAGQNRPGILS